MIKLITFDLDDTLWDNGPVIRRAIHEGYSWLLEYCPDLANMHDIASLDLLKDKIKNSTPDLEHRVSESRIVGIQQALQSIGYESSIARTIAKEAFTRFHHWRHQVELFGDAKETIAQLAQEYRLGIITNGNADVNRLGLGEFFEFTVNSEDMNRSKPDPEMFHHALKLAGVRPKQAIHIGDNLITDVRGAAEIGMKTVWFNPDGKPIGKDDTVPDFTVKTLAEIPAAIRQNR